MFDAEENIDATKNSSECEARKACALFHRSASCYTLIENAEGRNSEDQQNKVGGRAGDTPSQEQTKSHLNSKSILTQERMCQLCREAFCEAGLLWLRATIDDLRAKEGGAGVSLSAPQESGLRSCRNPSFPATATQSLSERAVANRALQTLHLILGAARKPSH